MSPPINIPRRDLPVELREVSVVSMTDPTAVMGSMEILDQDVINLDKNEFEVRRITVPFDDCCLIYHRSSVAVRTQTKIHADFDACTVLGPNARGSLDGKELRRYALVVAAPGAHAEIIVAREYESVAWLVPPKVLEQHLALRGTKGNFAAPETPDVWHPAEDLAKDLFELGTRISIVAESDPSIFNDNHWAKVGAQVEFMDLLTATIESCDPAASTDTNKKGKSYSQIVRTCEDYTLDVDGRRPYVSELCAAANVSERTLQYAFNGIMGMSPLTYLHRLRLHRARDELRKAENGSTTVTEAAMNWGFWHFGEFSRAYKNCFGEVPSATLRRESED